MKDDGTIQKTIDSFWETVPPVWMAVRVKLRETAFGEFDITVEQFHILRHIRRGAHSVSQLAVSIQISRPAISQGVEALVQKGFIQRNRSEKDRRQVRLDLSPAGERLLDAIFRTARQWMAEKMAALSEDEMQAVVAGLASLKKAFT